jgi:acyl-CoA synthetase (NDP forming)
MQYYTDGKSIPNSIFDTPECPSNWGEIANNNNSQSIKINRKRKADQVLLKNHNIKEGAMDQSLTQETLLQYHGIPVDKTSPAKSSDGLSQIRAVGGQPDLKRGPAVLYLVSTPGSLHSKGGASGVLTKLKAPKTNTKTSSHSNTKKFIN